MERRIREAPLFRERSRLVQALTGVVSPLLFGAVAGIVLGVSAGGYWAVSLVALAGGVLAGIEHTDGWTGADRGLVGGTLYGIGLLIAHGIAGTDAEVSLPGFAPILAVFTAIIGMLAGALGGRLRRAAMEHDRSGPSAPKRRPA
jgi:hypothetical protein